MSEGRKAGGAAGYLFVLPYLIFFVIFVIGPIGFGLVLSFMNWEMAAGPHVRPSFVGAGNYMEAMKDPYFWMAMKATFLFVLMAAPATVALALAISVGLAAVKRGKALYRAAFLMPMMINISVAGLVWRWFYDRDSGVFNALFHVKVWWIADPHLALPSIALMTVWWTVGGPSIVLLAGLQQIPEQYYEAAAIDGVSGWGRFWHITLPLIRPVLFFVLVMNIIGAFQVFGQTFMITRGGPEFSTRVALQYIQETSFANFHMGLGAAMSWMLFAVIALVSLAQSRLMRERQ